MSTGIAVMAKVPCAGKSKTRLIPYLSAEEAAALSAAFLSDVTTNLAHAAAAGGIVPYLAYAPAGSAHLFDAIVAPGTRMVLADGSNVCPPGVEGFGRCLLHAVQAVLDDGHDAACVLNADSPNLPVRLLLAAEAVLARADCVVMGPAEDGGYTLLGMRRARAHLFTDISWSTGHVAEQTRARAAEAGLPMVELDPWYDVDEPATLARLVADLDASGPGPARHTASCILRLGLAARTPCQLLPRHAGAETCP